MISTIGLKSRSDASKIDHDVPSDCPTFLCVEMLNWSFDVIQKVLVISHHIYSLHCIVCPAPFFPCSCGAVVLF